MKNFYLWHYPLLLLLLLPIATVAQNNSPIGWASLNGGTTGGAGGEVVRPTTRNEFVSFVSSPNPYTIIIQDTIELNLYERIDVLGNKTIFGLGQNATLLYGGLEIKGDNVILRNIRITGSYDGDWEGKTNSTDAITITGRNVWVDHCDLSASADGLLDVRSNGGVAGDYVTISWTRFSNHNKVMLYGSSETEFTNRGHLRVTFHHCWFDGFPERGVNQRMAMIRFGDVHIFNNFYDDVDGYCIGARFESDVVVENNYFRNSNNPHEIRDLGKGQKDPELVATGNVYEFSSGTKSTRGTAFNPSAFYDYPLDDPNLLPAMVMNGAGLMNETNNQPPVAVADSIFRETGASRSFNIDPIANDTDADGGDLRIAAIVNTSRGLGRIIENQITYIAPTDQVDTDTLMYQLVDTQGGIDTGLVVIQFATSTSTKDISIATNNLKIYPNPVKTEAIVEYKALGIGQIQVQVFDTLGKAYDYVLHIAPMTGVKGKQQFKLNTNQLPSGNYIIKILEGTQLSTGKFTVVK